MPNDDSPWDNMVCSRCGHTSADDPWEVRQEWIWATAPQVCPDCITADDVVAQRESSFWLNEKTGRTHIACACGSDLGEVPESRPADVQCLTCKRVHHVLLTDAGYVMRTGYLAESKEVDDDA